MDLKHQLGMENGKSVQPSLEEMLPIINLKLLANGLPRFARSPNPEFVEQAGELVRKIQEKFREYSDTLCPADKRLQAFLDKHFDDAKWRNKLKIPLKTFHLDYHGLARHLSLPQDKNEYLSEYVSSYRIKQGVLHNPASDRRTTQGTFHISEGGLPIPADKLAIPKPTFAHLLFHAFHPPESLLELPFTSTQRQKAKIFTSLFLRPIVSPEIPGILPRQDMEIRFFAPGSFVSNLDFVESIFGNAGDPYLPENDLGLDVEHFSGITGCVILAPHLTKLRKKDLQLPHYDTATPLQREQGMCWKNADELYNGGKSFKATFRTSDGIILTLIADNYFGYCKKEVKTQIGFAANMLGLSEEEHAGGALLFPSYSLGDHISGDASFIEREGCTFATMKKNYADHMDVMPEGYGVDLKHRNLIYIPEDTSIHLLEQKITWKKSNKVQHIRLLPGHTYMYPSGYRVHMEKHPSAPSWRLIGTVGEGTLIHKPCTVSGGGKSEISKSIQDSIIYKSFYIQDFEKDFKAAEEIIRRDFSHRFKVPPADRLGPSRPLLSKLRSLGSVVRLLTPSAEYTASYNRWLAGIPSHIRALVFLIKRFYKLEWGDEFRKYFSVDIMDGSPGNELNYNHRKLAASYLRIGVDAENNWQVFRLRSDYIPAEKLQVEDDITSSITLPADKLSFLNPAYKNSSVKFVQNCEYRLFQRPDDAIHKGYDKQTEFELSQPHNFISNFEPLNTKQAREIYENTIEFEKFTRPMKKLILEAMNMPANEYFVCSANPRIVNGKPSGNVRYLQDRQDIVNPFRKYVAEAGIRLRRVIDADKPVLTPVNTVMIGRRNNRSDKKAGILPLSVYNPLHYQELPELFMDFISSLTGKSPSTTGAGSEGAMTKGPFNAVRFTSDLNNALVSYILTGYQVYSTPAGYIGSKYKMDHDLSLLMPEIWSTMTPAERDANTLIKAGQLVRIEDFKYKDRLIQASRLGYRINERFLHAYFGRIFSNPVVVFPEDMLIPEKQGLQDFVEGVENVVLAQKNAAQAYLDDGSIEDACPPLRGLLHIMAEGKWEGLTSQSPEFRNMFTREYLLASDWYRERLEVKQERDLRLWKRHVTYLKNFLRKDQYRASAAKLKINQRLQLAEAKVKAISKEGYLQELMGTIGADDVVRHLEL